MFDNIDGNRDASQIGLDASNPVDFKTIYDAAMQMLFKISYRIVTDEEVAEDLAHDSLIKANEKAIVFPTVNDAKFWLIRVVKNASLNYVKRKERERKAYEKVLYESHRKPESGEIDLLKKDSLSHAMGWTKGRLFEIKRTRTYAPLIDVFLQNNGEFNALSTAYQIF